MMKAQQSKIAVISSRVGRIVDNCTGGMYSYRSSKAVVNMLSKYVAIDAEDRNIPVIILHPGIVKSNLDPKWKGGGNEDIEEAVKPDVAGRDLWRVLTSKGLESTGRYYHRSGEELLW